MGETIVYIIGFILMFGIPHFIDKVKEQSDAERSANEFMKKHFGEDYKDKMNRR